jgi:hypothetical protein
MRELTKILLSACTVCALGQTEHTARADTNPDPAPPTQDPTAADPTAVDPTQSPPPATDPSSPSSNPADTPSGTNPAPNPPPAPPPEPTEDTTPPPTAMPPPSPPPPTTTQTTTTTTTTTSGAEQIPGEYSYAWSEPALQSRVGVSMIVGGGATGFTEKTMRSVTSDVGGLWDLRLTIGSHVPLAVDVSYVGSATNLNGLPTGDRGTLVGTAFEGALRWNVLPHHIWTPYAFGGIGWQRYDVTGAHVSLADAGMNDHDNLLEFPMGAGLAYRMNGFVFDLRGTFRYTTDQSLVLDTFPTAFPPSSSSFAKMHTWEGSAALGYEF